MNLAFASKSQNCPYTLFSCFLLQPLPDFTMFLGFVCPGPDTWWVYYPSASGSNQSPIDVVTEEVTFDPELRRNQLRLCYRSTSGAETRHGKDREDQSLEPAKESLVLVNTGNTARVKVLNSQSCNSVNVIIRIGNAENAT